MNDLEIYAVNRNVYAMNSYLVISEGEGMIIDTPSDPFDIKKYDELLNGRKLKYVIYTHGHYDHIAGSIEAREHYKNAIHLAHPTEYIYFTDSTYNLSNEFGKGAGYPIPDKPIKENDTIEIGRHSFKVIDTPGHTLGGISLYNSEGHLFTGDTLFSFGLGRTDFKGGDFNTIKKSIEKLFTYPDNTLIYPGHNEYATKLSQRKQMGI